MKTTTPTLEKTSTLVARALGMTADELWASFRPATLDQLPSIVDMRRRRIFGNHASFDDAAYLQWRYDFQRRSESPGSLMVVARKDKILGMIGTEKVRLTHGAETINAVSVMDILVDSEIDGSGLGVWLNMAIISKNPLVLVLGSNPNSIGIITRLFHRLPNRKEYTALLDVRKYLEKRLQVKWGISLLAVPVNAALRLWRAVLINRNPSSLSISNITEFDESVEHLFARRWAAEDISFERSSRYLNWRFFKNPRAKYSVFAAFEANEMVAYAAYQVCQRSDGKKILRLTDWLVDARLGLRGFGLLMKEIVRRAQKERADSISLISLHARMERFLWRLGLVKYPYFNEHATVGVHTSEQISLPALLDGSLWFLNDANSDHDVVGWQ